MRFVEAGPPCILAVGDLHAALRSVTARQRTDARVSGAALVTTVVDRALLGVDGARHALWRQAVLVAPALARRMVADRGARLALVGALHLAVAFALTLGAPLALLLVGPLLLGVPHVVADLRYLVLARSAPLGGRALVTLVPLGAMTLLRAGVALGAPSWPMAEALLGSLAIALAALLTRGHPARARSRVLVAVGLALAVGIAALGVLAPRMVSVTFAHLHNFIAVALWIALARRDERGARAWPWLVGGLFVLGVVLFGSGLVVPWRGGPESLGGLELAGLADTLAPSLPAHLAARLVAVYAFAQAAHYAVWLRLVPGSLDARPAPSSFRRDVASLRADLGVPLLAIATVLAVVVPMAGLFDAGGTRTVYLTLVLAHGWIELAAIVALVSSGRALASTARA